MTLDLRVSTLHATADLRVAQNAIKIGFSLVHKS